MPGIGPVDHGWMWRAVADLELRAEPYDGPAAQMLIAQVQQEYVVRYGSADETSMDAAEFTPPDGDFRRRLPGRRTGGVRRLASTGHAARHRGDQADVRRTRATPSRLARLLLAEIEDSIRAAGYHQIWLETGLRQPEAIALYSSSGYGPIDGYGHYRDAPLARSLGKTLA